MTDTRPRLRHRHRADAGVSEKIQRLRPPAQPGRLRAENLPVAELLRKKTEVAEAGRLDLEGESAPPDLPAFRQRTAETPASASGTVARKNSIRRSPLRLRQRRFPECVESGPDQPVFPHRFELAEIAAVEETIFHIHASARWTMRPLQTVSSGRLVFCSNTARSARRFG